MTFTLPAPAVVLVVEDEGLVRMFAADALRDEGGFEVIEAASADEALTVMHAVPGISVLVTDVEMPGTLDGFALARRVSEGWPAVGIVVVTGRARPSPDDLPAGAGFIVKPYRATRLIEAVRAVLAGMPERPGTPDMDENPATEVTRLRRAP